jgi:2-C-methyl-D-erythritol 4-phosphate cytidylyltransferase
MPWQRVDQSIEIVAIHDAARPWLKKTHFEDLLSHLANDQSIEGVFPVIPATDSLRMKQGEEIILSIEKIFCMCKHLKFFTMTL